MLYHVPTSIGGSPRSRGCCARRAARRGDEQQHAISRSSGLGRTGQDAARAVTSSSRGRRGAAGVGTSVASTRRSTSISPMTFPDADAVRGYVASSIAHKQLATNVPDAAVGLIRATRRVTVFRGGEGRDPARRADRAQAKRRGARRGRAGRARSSPTRATKCPTTRWPRGAWPSTSAASRTPRPSR